MFPTTRLLLLPLLCSIAFAQSIAIFPDEYIDVPEGPNSSPNLPLANGTGRVMCLYQIIDLQIPSGSTITKVGFRQDATLTAMDTGRTTNLEIRMGWSSQTAASMSTTFDTNYDGAPVTVFGPANFVLPNLSDPANPLPDGRIWIPLATPFSYVPAGRNLIVEYRCFGNSGGGSSWNYRLDRADYYSPITYGPAGCPHAGGGTPNLTLQAVRPGLTFQAGVTTGPGNSFGFLLLVPGGQLLPPVSLAQLLAGVNPACTVQINLAGAGQLTGVTNTAGTVNWSFPIPNNPIYGDSNIACQAAFFDLFAPGGVVVSRGAHILTGVLPRSTIVHGAGAPATVVTGTANRNYCPVAFFEYL